MAVVKELDRVLSGKVISRTGGSFHRNMEYPLARTLVLGLNCWATEVPRPLNFPRNGQNALEMTIFREIADQFPKIRLLKR